MSYLSAPDFEATATTPRHRSKTKFSTTVLLAGSCLIGCGEIDDTGSTGDRFPVAAKRQATWRYDNYVLGKISPSVDIKHYLSGTPLTISWELFGPPRTGNFTLSVSGTVIANSLSPSSTTWVVPSVSGARGFNFKFELWDGIPFWSTGTNPTLEGIIAQSRPWTHGELPVIAPVSGEHVMAGTTYRVKWNWLGRGSTSANSYMAYVCPDGSAGSGCYSSREGTMYDWGTRTLYRDIDIPLSASHTKAYVQFETDEFNTIELLDETKRYFFID